jgi:hypothetical protein
MLKANEDASDATRYVLSKEAESAATGSTIGINSSERVNQGY